MQFSRIVALAGALALGFAACTNPLISRPSPSPSPTNSPAALSSAKDISAFSFASPMATGTVNGTAIAVTVPFGTDRSALVASFTTSGSSVKVGAAVQTSATSANDFSNPVTYTVTAADGSTQDYTVTIIKTYPVRYLCPDGTGGSVPVDAGQYASGEMATVLGNTGGLAKSGVSFYGWNTAAGGGGTARAAGQQFALGNAPVDLYAVWGYTIS